MRGKLASGFPPCLRSSPLPVVSGIANGVQLFGQPFGAVGDLFQRTDDISEHQPGLGATFPLVQALKMPCPQLRLLHAHVFRKLFNLSKLLRGLHRQKAHCKPECLPGIVIELLQFDVRGGGKLRTVFPAVFERFYRVDKSRSRQTGGTGLGLSIVKHAAAFHKAEIGLSSTLGKGTEIRLVFPKTGAPFQA